MGTQQLAGFRAGAMEWGEAGECNYSGGDEVSRVSAYWGTLDLG